MPIFLGKHKMPAGTTEDAVKESWIKYKDAAVKRGIKPLHATVNIEEGFAYCETEAQNAQAVTDAHADVNVPVSEVVEVTNLE